jgi:hypothetical protein
MRKGWYAQYAHVLAVARSLGKVPFEFPAIVGLPDQIAQGNAATVQQLLDARSEDSAVRGAAFFGESPERQPAARRRTCAVVDAEPGPAPEKPSAGDGEESGYAAADPRGRAADSAATTCGP